MAVVGVDPHLCRLVGRRQLVHGVGQLRGPAEGQQPEGGGAERGAFGSGDEMQRPVE